MLDAGCRGLWSLRPPISDFCPALRSLFHPSVELLDDLLMNFTNEMMIGWLEQ